jgi:hypothetical protein
MQRTYPHPSFILATSLLFAYIISICFTPCFGWESGILNVHVVPHSHNDPGWWRTFEGYYQDWTKGIISSVVEVLNEVSILSHWLIYSPIHARIPLELSYGLRYLIFKDGGKINQRQLSLL